MPTFTALASSAFVGSESPLSEGGVWTQSSSENSWDKSGGAAIVVVVGADSGMHYTGISWPNNQYSRAALTVNGTAGGTSGVGLKLRQASAAQTYYRFIIDHAASNNAAVNRIVAGVSTLLGSAWTQTFTDGDTFTFAIESQKVYVYDKNLALVFSFDDVGGGGPTTGSVGIDYSSTETSASLDNWEGGSFSASSSEVRVQQPFRAGRGPGFGPVLRRMMVQKFAGPYPVDAGVAPPSPIGRIHPGFLGPKARRNLPQKFPGVSTPAVTTINAAIGRWNWGGLSSGLLVIIAAAVGVWTWTGKTSPLSKQIPASVGLWSWQGKTSPLSVSLRSIVGAYSWQGKASPLSTSLRSTIGAYSWQGRSSPPSTSLRSTVGAYSWAGLSATLSTVATINASRGAYTWAGVQSSLSRSLSSTIGSYTWAGVSTTFPAILVLNPSPGLYFWRGVVSSVQVTADTRPHGWFGVSYRRKKPKDLDERIEETVASIVRAQIEGRPIKPVVSVSVKPAGSEEIVSIKISGLSKRDVDVILIAILASEL